MSLSDRIHHVAYRCKDAQQTVEWYEKHLGMNFVLAIAENEVPSTKAPEPYMHVFLNAGNGNVLAFFELPGQPEMGRDETFRRPVGQTKAPGAASAVLGPSQRPDIELELGVFIGPGNAQGEAIPIDDAEGHIFGLCLLNDGLARDLQCAQLLKTPTMHEPTPIWRPWTPPLEGSGSHASP